MRTLSGNHIRISRGASRPSSSPPIDFRSTPEGCGSMATSVILSSSSSSRCKGNKGIEGRCVGVVESRETPRCFCAKAGFWHGGGKGGNRIRNAATGGTSEAWNREVNTFGRWVRGTDCRLHEREHFKPGARKSPFADLQKTVLISASSWESRVIAKR